MNSVRLVAAAGALLLACTASEAIVIVNAGVEAAGSVLIGEVVIGPTRPQDEVGASDLKPYEATLQVLAGGELVTAVQSDASGKFRVTLPPGQYVLRPMSVGAFPRASEQAVTIPPAGSVHVRIVYDSGIR